MLPGSAPLLVKLNSVNFSFGPFAFPIQVSSSLFLPGLDFLSLLRFTDSHDYPGQHVEHAKHRGYALSQA